MFPEHTHEVDTAFDGRCITCVAARRIFCMDDEEDPQNQLKGSCQPTPSYCTWGGRDNWEMRSNFRQCDYKGVMKPDDFYQTAHDNDMLELTITEDMAREKYT